ncbi:phospholipase D family protein [Pseudomonas sp. FME51]|uniref:phospholipase D family protein n=1 Tax=Pseudomonas sp. FME51 TaxID=2742609 RepID=UPI00186654BD|nr:phospholipase D family protein [Pseudomonas sp. FME51]
MKTAIWKMGAVICALVMLAGCAISLPQQNLPPSFAKAPNLDSEIGRYVQAHQPENSSELSGFTLVQRGTDALAARLAMIDRAEHSLDLQYYIYRGDVTGGLIAERLLDAADRGVRVRLLLDDIGSGLRDFDVATLNHHPGIQVKLFNPVTLRGKVLKYFSKIGEFGRINYRMHNKLMVVDSQMFITGGRNIGDEYFSLSTMDFQDIDILGMGRITREVVRSFDDYWNANESVPVESMFRRTGKQAGARLRAQLETLRERHAGSDYLQAVAESPFTQALHDDRINWHWGTAEWLTDPPTKADPGHATNQMPILARKLAMHARKSEEELLLMSAYFIPGSSGQVFLLDMVEHGVDVGVLTNSLATTDVLAVHSGYASYRKPLLKGGVRIWELRVQAAQQERTSAFLGESLASLHAKAFVFDRQKVFVGSVNLDPRSIVLNTEAGVLVHQPELAVELANLFIHWTSNDFAFELQLSDNDEIRWTTAEKTWTSEPHASRFRRAAAWMLGWLPIEGQL